MQGYVRIGRLRLSYKYIENKFINKTTSYIIGVYCLLFIVISILIFTDHLGLIFVNLAPFVFILPLTIIRISSKFSKFLGNISYEIYLVQGVVFYVLRNYFTIELEYLYISLSMFFIVISGWFIKFILDRMDPFWDKLRFFK